MPRALSEGVGRRAFLQSVFLIPGALGLFGIGGALAKGKSDALTDDRNLKDLLHKSRSFNRPHPGDIILGPEEFRLLTSSVRRLGRLRKLVGHANFYLLGFDDGLRLARNYTSVGGFSREEKEFLERLFYENAAPYGFLGEKPLKNLTDRIPRRKVTKIPGSGNYLFKGRPLETYQKIRQDIGRRVVLTSGVRSVVKQFHLFLGKAYRNKGNLSLASRSLAPPGYSFHGVGDFDVGQRGFGYDNFTEKFVTTPVYRRLIELGYIQFRYPRDNTLGVRFEPWHISL